MTLFLSAGLDHTTILGSQYFLSFSEHIYIPQNTPKKSVTPLLYYFMNPNNFFFLWIKYILKDHSKTSAVEMAKRSQWNHIIFNSWQISRIVYFQINTKRRNICILTFRKCTITSCSEIGIIRNCFGLSLADI